MRRLLLLPAIVTAACGGGQLQLPGPQRASARLDEEATHAIAEILRFEDARRFDPVLFDRLATDPATEVRRRVALAAGRIGDPDAAPILVKLLDDDPDPAVRADAAFGLGELGDTSRLVMESLQEAVPAGWVPVRSRETPVVVEVLAALGKLGTPAARRMVEDALREADGGASDSARRVAAQALLTVWRFEDGPGRVPSAARYIEDPDPEIRWRAAYALMRLGEPEAIAHLLPLLQDDDHRPRASAARGLAEPLADSAGLRSRALAALADALQDDHPHVRINAVRALAGYGDDAPLASVAGLLQDSDPNVAIAAAGALGDLGSRAIPPLRDAAASQRPLAVRTAALAALAPLDQDFALTAVQALAAGDIRERYASARISAALGWDRAAAILQELARDPDRRVAVAALVAAGEMAADSTTARPDALRGVLLAAARGSDPRLRAVALRSLGPLLRADDIDALLDVYAEAFRDSTRDGASAAIAAIDALGSLVERGLAAGEALFSRFPPPEDRWVRRRAATVLGVGWGVAPTPVAAVEADLYFDIAERYIAAPLEHGHRPQARIRTDRGQITIELIAEEAPLTVHNFVELAASGFFDQGVWHRVVPNFVLQDGAPAGDPSGGPAWSVRDEINRVRYLRGSVGMAHAGPDTGGSQWFITHSPQPHLDGGYTVFGRVIDGMAAADRVMEGDLIQSIRIDG
jgi:cyclophilin family peptidyl-prolyl cis-trans isomerase/HEAT repeat protein